MHNRSVSSHLVSLKTELVQMTESICITNDKSDYTISLLTKGKVIFSELEFSSLVMLAATAYNKVQEIIINTHCSYMAGNLQSK